jgi:hypothetical protein
MSRSARHRKSALVAASVRQRDPGVHRWAGEGALSAERQEARLELSPRQCGFPEVLEHGPEEPGAAAGAGALERILDGLAVEHTQHLGLTDCPFHRLLVHVIAEVHERAGHGRAWDAVELGDIGGGEGGAPVDLDALSRFHRGAGQGDVCLGAVVGAKAVDRGRGAMGKDHGRAVGESCGHPATTLGEGKDGRLRIRRGGPGKAGRL